MAARKGRAPLTLRRVVMAAAVVGLVLVAPGTVLHFRLGTDGRKTLAEGALDGSGTEPIEVCPAEIAPQEAPAAAAAKKKPAPVAVAEADPKPVAKPTVAVNLNAVPWVELEIDGKKVGPTPIGKLPLSEGAHNVRAVFPDGRVARQRIQVDARNRYFQIR